MKEYLHSQRPWLSEQRLPGYAPDLNPVETLWGNIKGQELANRCSESLGEAATAVGQGMARARQSQQLSFAFLHHAGLSFLTELSLYYARLNKSLASTSSATPA